MALIIVFIINLLLISLCLFIHYETLSNLNNILSYSNIEHRAKVLYSMVFIILAHVVEIWIFALGFYLSLYFESLGALIGSFNNEFIDYVYFSFITYTSLGLGDIVPTGAIRFVTGIESLLGLVLIAWSASFLYFQMQQYWNVD